MERRLKKLKLDRFGKVDLSYQARRDDSAPWDDYTMSCNAAPRPEMALALQALVPDVLDICELPDDYAGGMTVASVSLSYGGDAETMGAVITALKALVGARAPLVLNTPHLPSASYSDGDEPTLGGETVAKLLDVEGEAFLYVDGDRAQGSLFGKAGAR